MHAAPDPPSATALDAAFGPHVALQGRAGPHVALQGRAGPPVLPFGAPVVQARFVRRYQRFFVDVVDDHGVVHVAHTANTGAMTGMLVPGARALLTRSDNPKRKLPLELEALAVGGRVDSAVDVDADSDVDSDVDSRSFVGCNTIRSNRVAEAFVRAGLVPGLSGYTRLERERPLGESRVDLLLDGHSGGAGSIYVEVKSVTLRVGDAALFPDAVSERATKHIQELRAARERGQAVALLFLVQRTDCRVVAAARAVDAVYADALARAVDAGVRVVAVAVDVAADGIRCAGPLPVELR